MGMVCVMVASPTQCPHERTLLPIAALRVTSPSSLVDDGTLKERPPHTQGDEDAPSYMQPGLHGDRNG